MDIHLCVDLQSTYIAAAMSSRFNHVGMIAIEKHSTERKRGREGRREREREHISTPVAVVLFITEWNNVSEFHSSSAISVIDYPLQCYLRSLLYYWSISQNNNCNVLLRGAVLDRILCCPLSCIWHM